MNSAWPGIFSSNLPLITPSCKFIAQPVLRPRLRRIGEENHSSRLGRGNVIVNDVALIVEIDGLKRLSVTASVDVEQIAVLAIEVVRSIAGTASGVARQDMVAQFQPEGVSGRGLRLRHATGGLCLP